MKKLISKLISKVSGSSVIAEPTYTMLLSNIAKTSKALQKLQAKQEKEFFQDKYNNNSGQADIQRN